MSVNTTSNKVVYIGDGATDAFNFAFKCYLVSEITVQIYRISTAVTTVLTQGPDFTVTLTSGDLPQNGHIDLLGAYINLSTDYNIIIERVIPITQLIHLTDNEKTPATVYEEAFDRSTMVDQQLQEQVNRTVQMPDTVVNPVEMPIPIANRYLMGVSATEVVWQAIVTTATTYPYAFGGGLDAAKPAAPSLGAIYYAYNTGKIYVCKTAGVWTEYIVSIASYALKTPVVANDVFLIEDSAAAFAKKKVTLTALLASITDLAKVKAAAADPTAGYLDAKVDGTSITVTANKLALLPKVLQNIQFRSVKTLPEPSSTLGAAACIMDDGTVRVWGNYATIGIGTGGGNLHHPGIVSLPATATLPISKVYLSTANIFVIDANGWVFGAGLNVEGELADGTATASYKFKRIGTLTGVASLSITKNCNAAVSVFAITTAGLMYAWGYNAYGQLGVGTTANVTTPTLISAGTSTWVMVDSSGTDTIHSVAVRANGTVWTTGYNVAGQLGLNDLVNRSSFTQVTSGIGALLISKAYAGGGAGQGCTFFVTSTGTLWATGGNGYGQLCQGDVTGHQVPQSIASVTGVSSLAISPDIYPTVCAVKTDGTVRTWGSNNFGQCGTTAAATQTSAFNPALAGITKTVIAGTGSYSSIYCLKSDGTIYASGYGVSGNNADGTIITLPNSFKTCLGVPKARVSDISAVGNSVGYNLCVLTTGGEMFMSGYNDYGQLGNGTDLACKSILQPVIF